MMETPESTERRYNTRFRGVPKSVLTYNKEGRRSKSRSNSTGQTEVKNDYVYTKIGRKAINKSASNDVKCKNTEHQNGKGDLPKSERKETIQDIPKPILLPDIPKSISISNITKPTSVPDVIKITSVPDIPKPITTMNVPKPVTIADVPLPASISVVPKTPSVLDVPNLIFDVRKRNLMSNGIHHEQTNPTEVEPCDELLLEEEKSESEHELDPKKEAKSPFHKDLVPTLTEFQITESVDSKTVWITSKEKLSFNNCNVASYNPKTKMFRCIICQAVGFMSRIGEHYLGTHCNAKVFQCPQCAYCSAWWRCVRNHMSKNHGISNAPASMWKNQPLLDEIMQLLQNLKYSVDCEDREVRVAENSGKRYICTKCPYATDRRDLFNRHENIHREEKPFQCYVCYKLFNRADHVKKHFCRIHKDYDYDINLIRRLPSKRSRLPVTPLNGMSGSPVPHHLDSSRYLSHSIEGNLMKSVTSPSSQLLNCLTGPSSMARFNQESLILEKDAESYKNNKCNLPSKPPSNLLSFLMRNDFPPKPPLLEMSSLPQPPGNFGGKCISEGTFPSPVGFPPTYNNVPKEFICPYCPWQTTDMWALRMHTSTHYTNACTLCNYRSTQESDLELHMWECHRKRHCNKCNFLADGIMVLDAHMKEMHSPKHPFTCRTCSEFFEIRSDMEAHSIFVHNQILRECKQDGCDFCSTDPDILEQHRKEKHEPSLFSFKTIIDESASTRTLCLYCGCDFADPQSLSLHEELFHENPLQVAGRRPLDPYCCAICGYATPVQLMMMEHMRIHTGQALYCLAGEGCYFRTPYDTVLREHVLQNHAVDDGIIRCPHCGLRCSTRYSFVTHYEENHHPFSCVLCEEVEHKHFVLMNSSYLDSAILALFPFSKNITPSKSSSSECSRSKRDNNQIRSIPQSVLIIDTVRRSRKQLQPRKHISDAQENAAPSTKRSHCNKKNHRKSVHRPHSNNNNFISFYAKKVRSLAQVSLLRCKFCVKNPVYFRYKRNYVFHVLWHRLKKYRCKNCVQNFDHRYQVLLHKKREHCGQKS